LQEGDELGGVPERIGDRRSPVSDADGGPQLASHLGDQQRPAGDRLGIETGETAKRGCVVGICETDRDAEPLIEWGATASPSSPFSIDEFL
jgi:hypothetical protein